MVGQRGSGALVMVILILMMGTALLHATRRQLQDSLALVSDEQRYIEQFIRASSALAWGGQQTWPDVEAWLCQRDNVYSWRACILNHSSGVLLRGDSGEGTLSLYRWVRRLPAGTVSAIPHGWLDYCPLAERSRCDVSAR